MKKAVLVTGPAGAGKTAYCLRVCSEAMRKCGPGEVIYLVPGAEAVRDIERRLLLRGGCRGVLGHVVMDFVQLARRILKEAGFFPLRRIRPLERKYLILRILRETPLRFFEQVRSYEGFADVAADFIAELKRGMIPPEDFVQGCLAAAARGGVDKDKVHELHAIYRAYHDSLRERDAYDGDGLQWKAAEVLAASSSLFSGVETLLVDGFATYTPVEFEILTQLVKRVTESHITLCYQEGRPDVFSFVETTYAMLKKLCTADEIVLTGNHRASGGLLHLERTLFSEPENEMPAGTTVSILPCSDEYREVETVAREIERIREEEGLQYSDFVVIFRDVVEYLRAVTEVFEERRIPYFLAARGPIAEEPFVRALVSLLHLMNGQFRREHVLAVLKNSYLDADSDVPAAIENYADEFGLWDEEHFRQTWTEPSKVTQDVAPLNDFKARFLEMLDKLRSKAGGVSSAEAFRQFIFDVLCAFAPLRPRVSRGPLPSSLAKTLRRQASRLDDSDLAFQIPQSAIRNPQWDYRCLTAIARLLDTICEYARLANLRQADYSFFLDMLQRGLVWMPSISPPRNFNSVRVIPIVGGPPPEAAVVFVCGLCERLFPREIANEPFFKDRERRLINRRGKIVLDERLPLSSGERFFFYVAVSSSAGRLVLTYPATDRAGKELVRSHYVEEVTRLFSDLQDVTEPRPGVVRNLAPEFKDLADASEMCFFIAHHLSRVIAEGENDWDKDATMAALTYNELGRLGVLGADDLVYQGPATSLSEEVCPPSRKSDVYSTSVSELETFARCPFRHFCEYRLRLKELPRYEFGPLEEGMLYHEVLARLYRGIYLPLCGDSSCSHDPSCRQPRGIESLSPKDLDERLTLLVNEFIGRGYTRLFRTPRMEVRRRALQARIRDFLLKEVENERANATRPTFFELSFGRGKSRQNANPANGGTKTSLSLHSKKWPLVRISGRLDRVDIFEEGEEKFGVVLDYKRSAKASSLDLRSGTVLQPGVYMLALKELFGVEPAGAFYYSISSARKRGIFAAEEEERLSGQGDISRTDRASYEEIRDLMDLNARQAVEYVWRIMEGEIAARPADEKDCRTCPFSSVCRIKEVPVGISDF